MSFQTNKPAQHKMLPSLMQGRYIYVIITGITGGGGDPVLQFQHNGDTDWVDHPEFDGTITDGAVIQKVFVLSGLMRVSFPSAPSAYNLSYVEVETNN
jgi:hypothetical protein